MIFPKLKNKTFGYLNLDLEAKKWYEQKNIDLYSKENILINPTKCEEFIKDTQEKYSLDFSYGGWMEDREFIWRGWYLDKEKTFIHLGVDINAPAGTEIAVDFEAEVIKINNDYPLDGGWGPHIIFKHLSRPFYVLYAHLDKEIFCKVGDILKEDTIFAKVGIAPQNGNWFPHTHVQIIEKDYYLELEKNNGWEKFDGYGLKNEIEINSKRHPDPMQFVSLSKI